jgi:Flp pilus assembly protein TadG
MWFRAPLKSINDLCSDDPRKTLVATFCPGFGQANIRISQRQLASGDTMLRRLSNDDRGASAVEFALIIPVFLVLVMGVIEFGMIAYTYNASTSAARNVARQLATNRIKVSDAGGKAKETLPTWVKGSATVAVNQSNASNPSSNEFTVDIKVPASDAAISNVLIWAYGSLVINTKVTMQQEPQP